MKLSKRELALIYILICMVVFICGIFLLVMPSFSSVSTAKSNYELINQQLVSTKNNMPDYSQAEAKLKEAQAALDKIKKEFYTEMNKEDIDQIITTLAVEHNLIPVTLNISDIAAEEVISYEDYLTKQTQTKDGSATSSNTASIVTAKTYNISLVVQGNVSEVQQLVNDANKTYSMKIASVQYSNQQEDTKQMTVTFKVYMI